MVEVDVGNDFYYRLANRNKHQGDGNHTAKEFRSKYLTILDNANKWSNDEVYIIFNFKNVHKIGPSFANEAFAYFMKYTTPDVFNKKVQFKEISKIQKMIINKELDSGYSK